VIDYGHFQFACPPCVGGRWFQGVMADYAERFHFGFNSRRQARPVFPDRKGPNTLRVSLVSHPVDWLLRYHAAASSGLPFDDVFGEPVPKEFNTFACEFLFEKAGRIGRMFAEYDADVVWRLEDLPHALFEFMRTLGMEPPPRVADSPGFIEAASPALHNHQTRRMLMKAEEGFCERYEYY